MLASVPVTAGALWGDWGGWGSSSLPRRVRGAQDMQPAGGSEAPGTWGKQGGTLCLAGVVPGLSPVWAGQGLVWGTGGASWGAGTGCAAPRQEAATETPKQLCSEVVGRNSTPGGDRMGPQSSHSWPAHPVSSELQVTGRGHCSGGLTVLWGSRAFRLLTFIHPCCAKLSSGAALHPVQRLELAPVCWG